jgi:hypothetical protein
MATKSALARPVIYTIFIMVLLLLFPKCQKDDSFDQAALNDFLKNLQPISELMPAEKMRPLSVLKMKQLMSILYVPITLKLQQATMNRSY